VQCVIRGLESKLWIAAPQAQAETLYSKVQFVIVGLLDRL
jgi:hypothetical protein